MKRATSKPLPSRQSAELKRLARMRENQIDTADIPEVRDWSGAKRGVFFRPNKQQLTLRLDADVVDWFRRHAADGGRGYQTAINRALREHVRRQMRQRRAS